MDGNITILTGVSSNRPSRRARDETSAVRVKTCSNRRRTTVMLATRTSGPGEPCEWRVSKGDRARIGTGRVLREIYIKEIEI